MATCWTVRGSNPGRGEIFRTFPDRPWGPRSLLYNGYRVFPGGKERPGRDADPSPPSSAVVMIKGRAIPLLPLWAVRPVQSLSACTRVTFAFTLLVPSTDENSFDLDSGNAALHFRANLAQKLYTSCRNVLVTASCYFPLVAICQLFSKKAKNKI